MIKIMNKLGINKYQKKYNFGIQISHTIKCEERLQNNVYSWKRLVLIKSHVAVGFSSY